MKTRFDYKSKYFKGDWKHEVDRLVSQNTNISVSDVIQELWSGDFIVLPFKYKRVWQTIYDYIRRNHIRDLYRSEIPNLISASTSKDDSNRQIKLDGFEEKPLEEPKDEKRVLVQNVEPLVSDIGWNGEEVIRFGLMGDTQMGSKYAQITYLNKFYDICEEEGIDTVYHTGDISDGIKMRTGHEYELYAISADQMVSDIVKNYPKRKGITTKFITGNHDGSLWKHVGFDIGKAISDNRDDLEYLGRDVAVVNLTPNCVLELRHPWDGTAYAHSYKIQKMVEAMEPDSKPNILAVGHYHKAEYLFYRNIHCFQTGCFQGQTPFTRGKGISISIGGWIVEVHVDKNGTITRLSGSFIPFYKSIKDDYKNYI